MAPELLDSNSDKPCDIWVDMWSFGILAYELAAGHNPYKEAQSIEELASI